MPDDYYVSEYSGEEIDALLGGAGAGTVRYDAAQSLTDEQKQQARANINAAPDGFGYGGALDTVSGATDEAFLVAVESKLATMSAVGAMQINWGSYPALDGIARVGTLTKHTDGQYASLTGYSYAGTAITRCKNAGTWGPWEWVNPSMQLGVEYRTTERYLGRPVYAQLVNLGAAPSPDTWKSTNIPNAIYISLEGTLDYSSYRQVLPIFAADGSLEFQIKNSGDAIVAQSLHGTTDYSSQNVYVLAKYIKSTD